VVFIDDTCTVLPSGILSEVTTVVPLATDGNVTASALPAVTARLFDVVASERRVVGVFEVAIATNVLALSVTPDALGEGVGEAVGVDDGCGLADGEGVGLADGEGVGVALGVGVADALGEGVGLADGEGLADGDGDATAKGNPPPPVKPPPPPP
jgi:hypothetical protein